MDFTHLPHSCGVSPSLYLIQRSIWEVHLVFFSSLSPAHSLRRDGGDELYHTFFDGLAKALDELQTGNSSDALVSSIGSKRGVY